MTILVDKDIRWLVEDANILDPFSESVEEGVVASYGLTSAGYDLRLGSTVKIFKNTFCEVIDPARFKDEDYLNRVFDTITGLTAGQTVTIPPNGYILAYTLEYIRMPTFLKGRCVGKSTYARCGIMINTTPLEPGWKGHLTLEIANTTPNPSRIYVGQGIAQLEFEHLTGVPERTYADKKGKYQDQTAEPVPARFKPIIAPLKE